MRGKSFDDKLKHSINEYLLAIEFSLDNFLSSRLSSLTLCMVKGLSKLGRDQFKRQSMLRQLTTHLFEHEQIKTTVARAKCVQRLAERCISMAKRGSTTGKLKVFHFVNKPSIVQKVLHDIAPRFMERFGGYTRVLRYDIRAKDRAPMALIELVGNKDDVRDRLAAQNKTLPTQKEG